MASKLAQYLKHMRKEQNLSLTRLARLSGVSRGYLYLVEDGEHSPTLDKLIAISAALGMEVGDLLVAAGYTANLDSASHLNATQAVQIAHHYLTLVLKEKESEG